MVLVRSIDAFYLPSGVALVERVLCPPKQEVPSTLRHLAGGLTIPSDHWISDPPNRSV